MPPGCLPDERGFLRISTLETVGTLLLIRHGQASFGAADYDQLSEHGRSQAALVGQDLAARQVKPTRMVSGSLRRQRDTLSLAAQAAGWPAEHEIDARWDEFRHTDPSGQPGARDAEEGTSEFERRVDFSIDQWFAGHIDSGEPFGVFRDRVVSALRDTRVGSGETHVVFTSSGVIAAVTAHLLGADGGAPGADNSNNDPAAAVWPRLNRVAVNSGVTKVVVGRRGMSLVSFNDHSHLAAEAVTYR